MHTHNDREWRNGAVINEEKRYVNIGIAFKKKENADRKE
jgi:hypothetical protein